MYTPKYNLGNMKLLPNPSNQSTQILTGYNSMMNNILDTNQSYNNLANQLKEQTKAYQKGFDKFNSQLESIMNDLLAKKNTSTGNIFNDFLTSYKSARESGVGSGLRNSFLSRLPESIYGINQGFDNSIHGKDF